jgi:hypothetical protein
MKIFFCVETVFSDQLNVDVSISRGMSLRVNVYLVSDVSGGLISRFIFKGRKAQEVPWRWN